MPLPRESSGAPKVYIVAMSRIALVGFALLAAACAGPSSLAGRPEAELRARMGAPAAEYPGADGSRTLAYPMGFFGAQTYMAEVAPDGAVRTVREALNEESFVRISAGSTRDEVLRLIGPPRDSATFPRLGQVSWEYFFRDTWGYPALFFVNFDARGIVVGTFTRRIDNERPGLP